jgi:glycerophosphoryl diester phosphodiesterase
MNARPLLLGHRGAPKYAPENSVAAFDLALRHGCDGFEFDVRYTRDGRCVICHDAHHRNRPIDACLSDELDLPSAEDVIRSYGTRAYLDIELKVSGDARCSSGRASWVNLRDFSPTSTCADVAASDSHDRFEACQQDID